MIDHHDHNDDDDDDDDDDDTSLREEGIPYPGLPYVSYRVEENEFRGRRPKLTKKMVICNGIPK